MKYRKAAKPLAMLVASLLAFQPVTAMAVTFADMNQAPWPGAEVSINKAASLGLVVGETINGKSYFRPKDSVSLCESCQFAYKVLLQTKKASADSSVTEKWETVLNTYKIQSWAHPAVSFCLENGIISISDLGNFVKNGFNMPASRERAGEILGRALTVGVPSYSATATTTKFGDNASISSDARPYIALLNQVGIINGDDLGNFNPKKTLNRTETAVMVTNLYEELDGAAAPVVTPTTSTKSGTVKDMNNLYVNFENSNAYYLYSSSNIPVTLNADTSSIAEVLEIFKDGGALEATVTLNGSNRVTKLAVTSDDAETDTEKDTEGIITDMKYDDEDEDGKIEINDDSVYYVDDVYSVDIVIEDEDGDEREYDWEDLLDLYEECKDDDKEIEVELTLNKDGEITDIEGKIEDEGGSSKPDGDVEGDVDDVEYDDEDDEGEIKVDGDKYYFDDDTDIEIDDDSADWEDLLDAFEEAEDNDEVLEAVLILDEDDDDFATDIYIFTEDYEDDNDDDDNEDEVSGEIEDMSYDDEDYEGEIEVDGETYEAKDTDDVEIEVQDGDTELDSWEELYYAFEDGKEIEVEMVVDGDEVIEITGKVTVTKGILTGFGDDYLKLEGKDSEDSFKYYFTEYDRDDEDEEEDWEDDAKDIEVSGLNNIDNLYDFYDVWLDDDDTDLDDDVFDMEIKLDDDGFIVEIDAELD